MEKEAAQCLLADTRGNDDKTFQENLFSNSEYSDDLIIDLAIIFASMRQGSTSKQDIQSAIDFLDFADTMRLEIRRKEYGSSFHQGSYPIGNPEVTEG